MQPARKGRPPKGGRPSLNAVTTHVPLLKPTMKYREAAHLADKNSRTMNKISQLLNVIHEPGYDANNEKHKLVEKYIEKLTKRVNRRLVKLAKWSDSSMEDRLSEFRHIRPILLNGVRQYPYSKQIIPTYAAPAPVGLGVGRPTPNGMMRPPPTAAPIPGSQSFVHLLEQKVVPPIATTPAVAESSTEQATGVSNTSELSTEATPSVPVAVTVVKEETEKSMESREEKSEGVEESKSQPMDEEEEEIEGDDGENDEEEEGEGEGEGEDDEEEIEVDDDGLDDLVDDE